jgi:signal transduction histidine kinase
MKQYAEEFLIPLNIQCEYNLEGLPEYKEVPADVRHDLLLIYKEFLTNSIKHAKATKIEIEMKRNGKRFQIRMKDNGVGISDQSTIGTGQGLANMTMRAKKMNGTLDFIHEGGFGIDLSLPAF